MGVIQNSINQIIGSTTQAAGIVRIGKEMKKQAEAEEKKAAAEEQKATLQRLDAEGEYLKGESERNQELGNLNKTQEKAKIEADKAAQIAKDKEDDVNVLKGVFPKDDMEGQKLVRESEEKAKLAKAVSKAKQKEKLSIYKQIRERKEYLERQGQIAEQRARVYGLDVDALKGGKK